MTEALWEVEKQFQTMFKFAPTGIAIANREGVFIQSNPAFQELFGYTEEELHQLSFSDLIDPDDQAESFQLFQELLCGQRTHFNLEKRYLRKDGCLVWGNLSASVVCDRTGFPQYVLAMIQSISESQQTPLNLQEAHLHLEKRVTEQTTELEQANKQLNQEITERQTAQEALKVRHEFLQTLIDIYPSTVFAKGSFAVVTDATTLEAMASELKQTKEQLRAVLDAMPGFVSWINSEGKYLGVNQYMADAFNLPSDAFVGKELAFLKNSPGFAQFMTQFLAGSAQTDHQIVEVQVNGSTRHYLIAAQKYHQDSLAVSVGIDITECKLAEAQIQASLQEKEVLLQEIHHRVKNNLQVISSLLDLQSQQIKEQAMLEVFRESQNRVKSMALVHEKLYQSQDFARINFAEYTQSLISYLLKAYDLNAGQINLEIAIDDITLNIDTAIPCGLIINELVSNAIKYAFPDKISGTIRINMYANIDDELTLVVEDNGVGFPCDWDFKTTQSLGIQLVNVLTKQLRGSIQLDRSSGSRFRVVFPVVHH